MLRPDIAELRTTGSDHRGASFRSETLSLRTVSQVGSALGLCELVTELLNLVIERRLSLFRTAYVVGILFYVNGVFS